MNGRVGQGHLRILALAVNVLLKLADVELPVIRDDLEDNLVEWNHLTVSRQQMGVGRLGVSDQR